MALFGLSRPLARGTLVEALKTIKSTTHLGASAGLRRPAWLFWEDLAYGADFEHPSVLLLIDAGSGRVIERTPLGLFPLVDGRPPPFLVSRGAYESARITYGDTKAWEFAPDFKAMESWADSVELKHQQSGPTPTELTLTINRVVTVEKCEDVFIFMAGHGEPLSTDERKEAGRELHMGPYNLTGLPGGPAALATSTTVGGGGKTVTQDKVTPEDLENTMNTIIDGGDVTRTAKNGTKYKVKVAAHPDVHFKIRIDSCFSQRFSEYLNRRVGGGDGGETHRVNPNLQLVEYCSSSEEFSWGYVSELPTYANAKTTWVDNETHNPPGIDGPISGFVNANIQGLETWASDPREGRGLPEGIKQAFTDGASDDFPRDAGFTHPGVDTPAGHTGAADEGGIPGHGAPPPAEFVQESRPHSTAPAQPAEPDVWGSDLLAQAIAPLGDFAADVEYWFGQLANALIAKTAESTNYTPSVTAPVAGTVTQITVKGYAIKGDEPGPGGSEPIRFSVDRPLPDGELEVITTTNPPFTLPGVEGTYTFDMSQVSFPCCKIEQGDVVSLDARGGELAVFGSVPGSTTDTFSATGNTQEQAAKWTAMPHPGTELLMQITEQPGG